MSILTKEERGALRRVCEAVELGRWDDHPTLGRRTWLSYETALQALDTIDAMERTIKGIERATSMHQVETCLIAARAFGIIEEDEE